MAETNGHNNPNRLDRVEGIIEALANRQHIIEDEFARLLRAQVVTVDIVEKLSQTVKALGEAQKHADQRMDALILTVDEIVRGRKQS
jgi:hypothetical protein